MGARDKRPPRKTGLVARGVDAANAAPDPAAPNQAASSGLACNARVDISDSEIRLGCLFAAIELRHAGSVPGELLVTAASFYEFVTGARGRAPGRDTVST